MSQISHEIFEILGVELINGSFLKDKMVTKEDLEQILGEFSKNPSHMMLMNSFFKIMTQEKSEE